MPMQGLSRSRAERMPKRLSTCALEHTEGAFLHCRLCTLAIILIELREDRLIIYEDLHPMSAACFFRACKHLLSHSVGEPLEGLRLPSLPWTISD